MLEGGGGDTDAGGREEITHIFTAFFFFLIFINCNCAIMTVLLVSFYIDCTLP